LSRSSHPLGGDRDQSPAIKGLCRSFVGTQQSIASGTALGSVPTGNLTSVIAFLVSLLAA